MSNYLIRQVDLKNFSDAKIDVFVNGVLAVLNTPLKHGDVIKAVCKPSVIFGRTGSGRHSFYMVNALGDYIFPVIVEFNKIVTLDYVDPYDSGFGSPYIEFTATTDADPNYTNPPVADYVWTQPKLDLLALDKVTLSIADVVVVAGFGMNNGDKMEITANNGYEILNAGFTDGDGFRNNFAVKPNKLTATLTYSKLWEFDGFSANTQLIDTTPPVIPPDYVWTQAKINSLQNVVLYVNNNLVVDGFGMFRNDVMKIVVNNGYEIVSAGYRDGDGYNVDFTVADDYKSASLVWSDVDGFDGFVVETRFVQAPDVKGYNDIYRVTDVQMREVATASFEFFNGQTTVDFGKYIIGAIDLPFEIQPDQITGSQNISLGKSTTGINAELLTTDAIRVDMGSIFVPRVKDNLLDFANTVAVLHLPYAESVMIDIDYVIGETISIEYLVSLYDGLAIINVSSSKIDGIINTRNVDLNVSIPFGNIDNNPSNNDPKNVELGGDNGIKTPHIEILRNDAVLENGFFTIPIIDESALINQIGFVKVDEIELMTSATMTERNKINSLLTSGVILK